ncbi:5512_t:CDS:2, partial [Cetraspora pellucida]
MELFDTGNKIIDHDEAYEDQENILPHEECCNDVQENISSRARIVKRRLLETLSMPDDNYAYLVLLAYGQQTGFVWQIRNKKLNKTVHNRESVKMACTCFINMSWPLKSSNPSITKMNLEHHGHVLNPRKFCFANVYQQLPQNVMDKIKFY